MSFASMRTRRADSWACSCGLLRAQQRLDGAALVHGPVTLGHLIERQRKDEDLAGIDLAIPDEVDQVRQVPAHRRGTAVQTDVREEQPGAVERHAMWNADIAHVAARPRGADGLHHGLLRSDALQDRLRANATSHLLDAPNAIIAALGHDLGRSELARELLAGRVPTHGDDPARAPI